MARAIDEAYVNAHAELSAQVRHLQQFVQMMPAPNESGEVSGLVGWDVVGSLGKTRDLLSQACSVTSELKGSFDNLREAAADELLEPFRR